MAAKRPRTTRAGHAARKDGAPDAADLRLLARDAALAALKRLADLSRSEDERVALAATQELLNRAFGKASATTGNAEEAPAHQPLVIKIVRFSETDIVRERDTTMIQRNARAEGAVQPPMDSKEMEAMARRAWRERGIVILWPDKIRDEWDRQHVLNIAANLYGKR